ncbi:MAG: hypothetical protein EBT86_10895 [Actinobacteria bacterium]|nr:hypothetical protein [Actinomycetota bacterium]
MLRELFSKVRTPLMEGGNVFDECEPFDQSKAPQIEAQLERYLRGTGLKVHRIGSGATPTPGQMSSDLDVMVDLDIAAQLFNEEDPKKIRIELEKYLNDKGLETKRIAVTIHVKLPFGSTCHQVDVKVVRNATNVHKFHIHEIPKGSSYKGVHKQMIINALASSQNLLWSPDEGLYARDQQGKKTDLISTDLDEIARYLIGPNANARSLGSVESIMAALPDAATRQKIYSLAAGGQSWKKAQLKGPEQKFFEAAGTGRKYQHIEDLIFTGIPSKGIPPGYEAGLHAVRILNDMATKPRVNEIKWDGSPVVYWGRDEQNRFSMIPKNAWEYLKKGKTEVSPGVPTIMYSPNDIKKFILGTGKTEFGKEQQRQIFANQFASLWPYFAKISPPKGYLEGGILFSPLKPYQYNKETEEFDFQPNITGFHVHKDSELGKKLARAKVMVAATGYYDTLGSSEESRYPDAEQLSTGDVIVQGTTYVEKSPGIDTRLLDQAESYISKNKKLIDGFLAPKPGLSRIGNILYSFYNENYRIEGVKNKFVDWAQNKLSANQAAKITNDPGLDITLTAVELLSIAKMDIYNRASTGTHNGIRQSKPEGYVYQDPETGQFVKNINQQNWAPRKDE